jgi:DNA repair protein RecO (recombination protein O)
MSAIRDQGVVLARYDFSETSQTVAFFTRGHGKVRAIAKGIKRGTKKRFAVGLDLLNVGELVVTGRPERGAGLVTLTEWRQTKSLVGLGEAVPRLHGAEYAAEITAALTQDWDPHADLFDALISTLARLCDADEPLGLVVDFQWALLRSIGLAPRFDACTLCGRSADLTHFSSFEGGMICRHCEPGQIEKREVPTDVFLALRNSELRRNPSGAFDVLDYHVAHLMGRRPRLSIKLKNPKVEKPKSQNQNHHQ